MTSGDRDSYAANAEFWVKIIREGMDRYRTELTDRAVLDAVGSCAGLTVLDGGCGEGYLSRRLAALGATASGIDTSTTLIAAAREEAERLRLLIDYRIASIDAIPYPDASFDVVVCNHVLTDLTNPGDAFREIGRVTKRGGRAVFMLLHPCFYTAHAERERTGSLPPDVYFSAREVRQKFKVAGFESPGEVLMTFRPLEDYMSMFFESGFVLTHLSEPHPSAEQLQDEWWRTNFSRPLFMLLVGERR